MKEEDSFITESTSLGTAVWVSVIVVYPAPSAVQPLYNILISLPHSLLPLCRVSWGYWTNKTVTHLYYLMPLFQITHTPPFHDMFLQFTVKLIGLQLSSSTFQSCRYALITLIILGDFPSLHQQHIYNHVIVLFHSQSHSEPFFKSPGHLTAA